MLTTGIGFSWSLAAYEAIVAAMGSAMAAAPIEQAIENALLAFCEVTAHSLPGGRVAMVRARLRPNTIDVLEVEVLAVWAVKALLAHERAQGGSLLTPP